MEEFKPGRTEVDWDEEAAMHFNDTERREMHERAQERRIVDLEQKASTDILTGLLNRQAFVANMTRSLQTLAESRRSGDPGTRKAAILMCDIDHFKSVNDTYGHQAGDEVLKHVAQALKSSVRPTDSVGRFGGEEFIIGLTNGSLDDIKHIAEELRADVEHLKIEWQGQRIPITASFGVREIGSIEQLEAVLADADQALYAAKRAGRNRVEFAKMAA